MEEFHYINIFFSLGYITKSAFLINVLNTFFVTFFGS